MYLIHELSMHFLLSVLLLFLVNINILYGSPQNGCEEIYKNNSLELIQEYLMNKNSSDNIDVSIESLDVIKKEKACSTIKKVCNFNIIGDHYKASLCDENNEIVAEVSGTWEEYIKIPSLNSVIQSGEKIKDDMIDYIKLKTKEIKDDFTTTKEKIVGMEAKNTITPGKPIKSSQLSHPILVRKNSIVNITYETATVTLSTKAKALENGTMDQWIRLKNQNTNKEISGKVIGENAVSVE